MTFNCSFIELGFPPYCLPMTEIILLEQVKALYTSQAAHSNLLPPLHYLSSPCSISCLPGPSISFLLSQVGHGAEVVEVKELRKIHKV